MATLYYSTGDMNSLDTLQRTCNTDELNLERKLKSLDLVLNDGEKATEAVYEDTDPDGLGELTIEEFSEEREGDALFRGKAYILTQPVDVLVFR